MPEMLRCLTPLAPTLKVLNLDGNRLGGMITQDIELFIQLESLAFCDMGLEGRILLHARFLL
jgi:hypothetical protein